MRRVRLTEGQLHRIIRNAVNEAIKGGNGFSSYEDMSDYRDNAWDKFSPDDDKRGPYWDQSHNVDNINDFRKQLYNADMNRFIDTQYASKGSQMNYDWDEQQRKNRRDFSKARDKANFDYDSGLYFNDDDKWYPGEDYSKIYAEHDFPFSGDEYNNGKSRYPKDQEFPH